MGQTSRMIPGFARGIGRHRGEQHFGKPPPERLQRRAEARERRREIAAERRVDDDDHRDVATRPQAHLGQRLAAAKRHRVVVEDDRSRRIVALHHRRRHRVAASLVDTSGGDKLRVGLDPVPAQRLAVAGQEQMPEVQVRERADGGDPAVAARDEPVHRVRSSLLEVEVERGIGCAAGKAPSERRERKSDVGQIVDALIVPSRPSEHDCIRQNAPRRRGAGAPADSRPVRPSPP